MFSVTELVCAVVVTHVATLLVVVLLVAGLVRHRAARRRRQQALLPPVNPVAATARGGVEPRALPPVGVSSAYRHHNGFPAAAAAAAGLPGRSTPYANDCLYDSGTMRSGFSYTPAAASSRR